MRNSPLLQAKDIVALRTLGRKVRDTEPAGLAVITGAMASCDDVFDDFLAGGCRLELRLVTETTGQGEAGE